MTQTIDLKTLLIASNGSMAGISSDGQMSVSWDGYTWSSDVVSIDKWKEEYKEYKYWADIIELCNTPCCKYKS
jgi:hypothetical protein